MIRFLLMLSLSALGMVSVAALAHMMQRTCGDCTVVEHFWDINLGYWVLWTPIWFVILALLFFFEGLAQSFFQAIDKAVDGAVMMLLASVTAAHVRYFFYELPQSKQPFDATLYLAEMRSLFNSVWGMFT